MRRVILTIALWAVCGAARAFDATPLLQYVTAGSTWTPASLGPVAWWKLDGNGTDSSGYGNTCTLYGSPTNAVDRNGVMGGALAFNGSSQYGKIADTAGLNITTKPLTIIMWVSYNIGSWLLYRGGNGAAETQYGMYLDGGAFTRFYLQGSPQLTTASFSTGTWTHLAMVWGVNGVPVTYKNGVSIATGSAYTNALTSRANIILAARSSSADGSTVTLHSKCLLDDVLIFNRALTPAEITQLYNWRQP